MSALVIAHLVVTGLLAVETILARVKPNWGYWGDVAQGLQAVDDALEKKQ